MVVPTKHEISITLSKTLDFKLQAVSHRLVKTLIHPNKTSGLHGIQFDAHGKRLIAGDYPGGVVAVWDVETAKRITTIETGYGYRGSADYFFITSDWKTLFVSRPGKPKTATLEKAGKRVKQWVLDGDIRTWDLTTGELRRTYRHDPPRYIYAMTVSADGSRFVTYERLPGNLEDRNNALSLWDASSGKFIDLEKNVQPYGIFAPDGKTLATAIWDKAGNATAVCLLDSATAKQKLSPPVNEKNMSAVVSGFSRDGKLMLVRYVTFEKAGDGKNFQHRIELLDTKGKKLASLVVAEKNAHLPTDLAPDGQTLAIYHYRGEPRLILFSIPENRVLKTVLFSTEAHAERTFTRQAAFSPDGKQLAVLTHVIPETGERDDPDALDLPQPRIHLIDVLSGQIRDTLVAPQGFSMSLSYSPDGRTLAVGGHGRVLLFDVAQRGK